MRDASSGTLSDLEVVVSSGGGGGAVDSVDGRTGVVTLGDRYVDVGGDTMTGTLVAPRVGIGVTPTQPLDIARSDTDPPAADRLGIKVVQSSTFTTTEAGAASNYGVFVEQTKAGAGTATSSNFLGAFLRCTVAAGNANSLVSLTTQLRNTGAGALTDARGVYVNGVTNSGGGTIALSLGIDVGNQGAAGITNSYGLRVLAQAGSTNTYGVAVGTAGTASLWVGWDANSTTAAGGITFGASRDTSIFRLTANTIGTSGGINPGGVVYVNLPTSHASGGGPVGNGAVSSTQAWTSAVNATSYVHGGFFCASLAVPAGVTLTNPGTDAVNGVWALANVTGDGTYATGVNGMMARINKTGTGVLNAGRCFLAYPPSVAGTVTDMYGIVIQPMKVAGVTNAYGVYQQGGADNNYFAGRVSIGTTDYNYALHVNRASTVADSNPSAQRVYHSWTATADTSGVYLGGFGATMSVSNNAGNTFTNVAGESISGATGSVLVAGAGTFNTYANGLFGLIQKFGTSTLSEGRAIVASGPLMSGGSITTATGVDIGAQKLAGVTNGYGIYQRGGNDLNYFAGAVLIGANPAAAGAVRLSPNASIYWRTTNGAVNGPFITEDSSDNLQYSAWNAASGPAWHRFYCGGGEVLTLKFNQVLVGQPLAVSGNVGFYGTAPVAKPSVSAAATDATTTQALANSLRTALLALGLAA